MIDWGSLAANALWVLGLALGVAVVSHASYRAHLARMSARAVIGRPAYVVAGMSALALICLGLALTAQGRWWEPLLWWILAAACGVQAVLAIRQQRNAPPVGGRLRLWLRGTGPLVAGLIALGMVVGGLYALIILPWMQPDEPRHFEVAYHVAHLGKPVVTGSDLVPAWEQEMIAAMENRSFWWYGFSMVGWDPNNLPKSFVEIWGSEYARAFYQPPLYYALAGELLSAGGGDLGLEEGIFRLRLASLFLFGLSLLGIYSAIAELFPERPQWALGVLVLAALWPSHLASNAGVNPEVLAEVLVVWALFFAINILRRGPRAGNVFGLVALALLGVVTKRTALTAAVIVPFTFLFWAFEASAAHRLRRKAAWVALVAAIPLSLALLFVLVEAGRLVPPDFLAKFQSGVYGRALLAYPLAEHTSSMLRTFVGWFGWMRVMLPGFLYWLGAGLLVVAVLGVLYLPTTRHRRALAGWQQRGLLLLAIAIVVQLLLIVGRQLVYADFSGEAVPQMRYMYAVAPAIFLYLWLGWRVWVPQKLRRHMTPASLVLLLVFNAYVLAFLLYPFYWL